MNLKQLEMHCAQARESGAKDEMKVTFDGQALSPNAVIDLGASHEDGQGADSVVREPELKLSHAV